MSSPETESEYRTRRERIDPFMLAQGWQIVPFDPSVPWEQYTCHAVTEFETARGPAHYALFVAGRPLGIVEAKKVSLGPQNVLVRAERYSRGVADSPFDYRGFRVPFLYSANGEVRWFHDIRHPLNRSRRIAGLHTPAALLEMLGRDFDAACAWFTPTPNRHSMVRPYQVEANTGRRKAIADCVEWSMM
jgi:type I restriction enzyme, R subunit